MNGFSGFGKTNAADSRIAREVILIAFTFDVHYSGFHSLISSLIIN